MKTRLINTLFWVCFFSVHVFAQSGVQIPRSVNQNPFLISGDSLALLNTTNTPDGFIPEDRISQSEPSVAISPKNRNYALLAYNKLSAGPNELDRTMGLASLYYTGGEYTVLHKLADTNISKRLHGDPACAIDLNGNMFMGCMMKKTVDNNVYIGQGIVISNNDGVSWHEVEIANPPFTSTYKKLDKNHLAVDNTAGSPYSGRLYSAWTDFNVSTGVIKASYSSDHGESWSGAVEISHEYIPLGYYEGPVFHQGVNVQTGPDGTVYACWAVCMVDEPYTEIAIEMAKSTDGGVNWSSPVAVVENMHGIRAESYKQFKVRVNSFPVMSINMQTGRLYVSWVNKGPFGQNDGAGLVHLTYSENGGNRWSEPKAVLPEYAGTGVDQFFNWMACDPLTGILYIMYFDNRHDAADKKVNTQLCYTEDDGNTFQEYQVDGPFFLGLFRTSGGGGTYCGDYNAVACANGALLVVWNEMYRTDLEEFSQLYAHAEIAQTIAMVSLDQKNPQNVTDGTMAFWRNAGWNTFTAPGNVYIASGNELTFRATQDILSSAKFSFWDPSVTSQLLNHNHEMITIDKDLMARLGAISGTPTVSNSIEGTTASAGKLYFRDPWLVDETDPLFYEAPYGYRNLGMESPFKEETASVPLLTTSMHKGVLLKSVFDDYGYYSLKVQNQQVASINNMLSTLYLQGFNSSNIDLVDEASDPGYTQKKFIFKSNNSYLKAVYKGTQLSNNSGTFDNSGQRKVARTSDGTMHMVYESMGKVWYETSTDNGVIWYIMNNGQPLNTAGVPAKNPAITNYPDPVFPAVFVVFEEEIAEGYTNIKIKGFKQASGTFNTCQIEEEIYGMGYYATGAKPALCMEPTGSMMIAWECNDPLGSEDGIYTAWGLYYPNSNSLYVYSPVKLMNSDENSRNPAIAIRQTNNSGTDYFNVVWQENNPDLTSEVRYLEVQRGVDPIQTNYKVLSSGSGYTKNFCPSLIVYPTDNIARVSWIGQRPVGSGTGGAGGGESTQQESRVVFRDAITQYFWSFDNYAVSCNINMPGSGYALGWAKGASPYLNYFIRNYNFTNYYELKDEANNNLAAPNVQLINGFSSDFTQMTATVLKTGGTPYYFKRSKTLNLLKETNALVMSSVREGILHSGAGSFYFGFGDITMNSARVGFREINTAEPLDGIAALNNCLQSEAFLVDNNTLLQYSVQYGIVDSAATAALIGQNESITFSTEMIDAATGEVLAVCDNNTVTAANLSNYKYIGYEVNTNGLGSRNVKLRLHIISALPLQYSLNTKLAEGSVLVKPGTRKQVNMANQPVVTTYALDQNYPNPFNPATTISYQLPKAGIVTLKIYDMLGSEVKVLVNEYKESGKYTAEFNGVGLASGVYVYRLDCNDFHATKKLTLLK